MKTVKQILEGKTSAIYSVTPQTYVFNALEMMEQKNISSVLVMDGKILHGIFTERDYARKIILKERSSKETRVKEVMTSSILSVTLKDTIEYCMKVMTDSHIRHLPVLENGEVVGIISIGDVVKNVIESQKSTIDFLETYIYG
ncbi:CBS domain-containing protein [Desertivirga brevis]|uniref:CBS domain-containing protein n=1 Tax=Desertivirga brevis TaxID=2810310 RepID=UPI001A958072|nr:CBS domain-containing protein [Pedobacter sp. SYSU D00873]